MRGAGEAGRRCCVSQTNEFTPRSIVSVATAGAVVDPTGEDERKFYVGATFHDVHQETCHVIETDQRGGIDFTHLNTPFEITVFIHDRLDVFGRLKNYKLFSKPYPQCIHAPCARK